MPRTLEVTDEYEHRRIIQGMELSTTSRDTEHTVRSAGTLRPEMWARWLPAPAAVPVPLLVRSDLSKRS